MKCDGALIKIPFSGLLINACRTILNKACNHRIKDIQSTLVISNLKGPSETLRDIRSSTYQMFRIEENTNRTTKFNK